MSLLVKETGCVGSAKTQKRTLNWGRQPSYLCDGFQPAAPVKGFFICYIRLGKAGNRGRNRKRYWWLMSEKAHKRMAKLASLAERLAGIVGSDGDYDLRLT